LGVEIDPQDDDHGVGPSRRPTVLIKERTAASNDSGLQFDANLLWLSSIASVLFFWRSKALSPSRSNGCWVAVAACSTLGFAYQGSQHLSNRACEDYNHMLDEQAKARQASTPALLRSVFACPYFSHALEL
jgi:hypothetical protein